ncbi:MAG: 3-deoxy-D-manno-octulosonic acid kinase [Gammaproteobacteria bacterium]|nr:3-deoxy-D-manno-octulosonic acid kinase [Gammaproteobacteria bacterium]
MTGHSEALIRLEDDRGVGLVVADLAGRFQAEWFDPAFWARSCQPILEGGRGAAWFVDYPDEAGWVLRHYCRGGLPGRISRKTYVFLGESKVRAFLELRLLLALRHQGLPVPEPVAARYVRTQPGTYQASILVKRIAGACGLCTCVDEAATVIWRAAGACVRRFHDAGVYHADLNCTNILISPQGVHLIDFDRGVQYAQHSPSSAWKRANIKRLHRSVDKRLGDLPAQHRATLWQAFTTGYAR